MSNLHRQLTILAFAVIFMTASARAHEGHHHTAMGTVQAVDAVKIDLETQEGKLETFVLTAETSYKRGDAAATRQDVTVGVRAVVMYEMKDGKNMAIEVKLGVQQ